MVNGGTVQRDCGKRCEVSGRIEVSDHRGRGGLGEAYPAGDGRDGGITGGERVWAFGMHGVQQLLCSAGRVGGGDTLAADWKTDWNRGYMCWMQG